MVPSILSRAVLFTSLLLSIDVNVGSPLPLGARKNGFSSVVVFGDSLSDGGLGAYLASNKTWPADPHYFGHRFSDGKVWVEDLAGLLHTSLHDFATGGATSNNTLAQGYTGPGSTIAVDSVLDQVANYASLPFASEASSALFVVYAGANDAFFGLPNITAADSAQSISSAVSGLKSLGAKYILVPNLPPLGTHYPFSTLVPSYAAPLANFSSELRSDLRTLATSDPTHLSDVDFYELFNKLTSDPAKYGFKASSENQSCLQGVYMEVPGNVTVCSNPDEYIWWDEYHPTKKVHALMAEAALAVVHGKPWP